jgi:phosphoribosyl-ATP pyrophosphohydrolase/phosphoribosyl-AMP cyclohydrolase/histidinol dehydrogenase
VSARLLPLRRLEELGPPARPRLDVGTLADVAAIVADVEQRGEAALLEHARRLADLDEDMPWVLERADLERARDAVSPEVRALLERTAERVAAFAQAQRGTLAELSVPLPGGRARQVLAPVERAGCYAPGGRYPLPSSALMTAVTARAAGVREVWVASPRPAPVTLAAAAVAGADAFLAVGGAQAIAALAFGAGAVPPCDVVVGPGNRWVTAAKQLVAGRVGIDMLAGPSELVVVADAAADPALVAADLLAQAEHDVDARVTLIALDRSLAETVEAELARQLGDLPTAATARAALQHGACVLARDLDQAVELCDRLAPEHLQLALRDPAALAARLQHYGALFLGEAAAEVLGDYGAGPNHVLPTSGAARQRGGLSVHDFLRARTWLEIDDPRAAAELAGDAARLARLEGLEAHARAAERRLGRGRTGSG